MSGQEARAPTYDRQLLLLGPKRNVVLDLWEILRYGLTATAMPTMSPPTDCRRPSGISRASDCWGGLLSNAHDQLADAIGRDIAATANSGP